MGPQPDGKSGETQSPRSSEKSAHNRKPEKENFDADGNRQQLYFYGISAKLYCLFNLESNRLLVRKPSGHGLGFLQAPYTLADWKRRTGRKWKEELPPLIYDRSRDRDRSQPPPRTRTGAN